MRPDISMGEAVRLVIAEEVGNFRQLVGVWPVPVPEQKKESAIPRKKCKNCGDDSHGNDKSYDVRGRNVQPSEKSARSVPGLDTTPRQCHLFPAQKDTKEQQEKAEGLKEYGLLEVTDLADDATDNPESENILTVGGRANIGILMGGGATVCGSLVQGV